MTRAWFRQWRRYAVGGALVAAVMTAPLVNRANAQSVAGRNGVPAFHHIFEVVMENLGYDGAQATPQFARLAAQWALATNYYGVSHPSLPNYLALTGGSTFAIASDCVSCFVDAPNLFSQLASAHQSFAAYIEGVPRSCYLDPWSGADYASKHNPFRYYDNVRSSLALCSRLHPFTQFAGLLARRATLVPRFVWVSPSLCHDGHDCAPTVAATWLTNFIGEVTSSAAWHDHGVLLVTWDEGSGDSAGVGASGRVTPSGGGGHVMTLVVAPGLRRGLRVGVAYNHYSLLATVEDAVGVARLANARGAAPLSAFLSVTAPR